ncbi:MAG: TolC family protein [Gemmatimonadaceae bacterium]|nr:TolC family protein [Gemmatimonadaceae bacterium]
MFVTAYMNTAGAVLAFTLAMTPARTAYAQTAVTCTRPIAQDCATTSGPVRDLTMADAVAMGAKLNEDVGIARSQLRTAQAQISSARSTLFPQLSAQLNYSRAIRQPFQLGGVSIPDSLNFSPDSTRSILERLSYLERRTPSAALGALGGLFSNVPLGQANTYMGTLNVSQSVFDWRAVAGLKAAREIEGVQRSQLSDRSLDVILQIVIAYNTAVLNERLANIATSAYEEADRQYEQVRLREAAGNASRLDVLRASVDRDNLEPQRVQALNARDLAALNLKRLIDLPLATPVRLVDSLAIDQFRPASESSLDAIARDVTRRRPALDIARRQVTINEQRVAAARAASLPTVSLTGAFGKQGFPAAGLPAWGDLLDSWTVGVGVSVPIFSGGQRSADVQLAREQVRQSQLQLSQAEKQATLDLTQQRAEIGRAQAAIAARRQTARQASESYELTLLAYEKGNTTSLQVSDARLQWRQAQANEAQAVFDYISALSRFLRAAGVAPTPELLADPAAALSGGMR